MFSGCYNETCNRNTFNFTSGNMTAASCTTTCYQYGMEIAGIQHGNSCYCGNSSCDQADIRCETECGLPCAGDPLISCGGYRAIQIYKSKYNSCCNINPTMVTNTESQMINSLLFYHWYCLCFHKPSYYEFDLI